VIAGLNEDGRCSILLASQLFETTIGKFIISSIPVSDSTNSSVIFFNFYNSVSPYSISSRQKLSAMSSLFVLSEKLIANIIYKFNKKNGN
jgi:hypothetical protein